MSGRPVSTRPARSYAAAAAILAEQDPVLRRLVAEAGPARVRPPAETHFAALVRAIVYQQLAGAAAAAIHGRLIAALGGEVAPERLLSLPAGTLRSVGLSASKTASVQDLAAKVVGGTVVLDPAGLRAESDAEVVARLTTVRGIGKWTAEMFLMFQLRRLDVWPVGDLGVRKGFRAGVGHRDADGETARAARRAVPAVPVGGRLVLLAGGRAVRGHSGQCPHPVSPPDYPGSGPDPTDAVYLVGRGAAEDPWPGGEDPAGIVAAFRVGQKRPQGPEVGAPVVRGRGDGADRVLVAAEAAHLLVEGMVGCDHRVGWQRARVRGRGLEQCERPRHTDSGGASTITSARHV